MVLSSYISSALNRCLRIQQDDAVKLCCSGENALSGVIITRNFVVMDELKVTPNENQLFESSH